jgi:peptide/nickel transport system substrate-binding protein
MKTSNVPELKAVAEAARDDWQALGIPVSVELYEPGDLNQNVIRPRKYGALLFGMVIGRDQDLFAFWHSSERNDPGLNISLYANHTVDGLLEKQRAESDLEKRDSYLKQINTLIATDYPAAFTHTPDFVYSVPKDLKGVLLTQIAAPSDRFAGVTKWYRRTESVWPFFSRSF